MQPGLNLGTQSREAGTVRLVESELMASALLRKPLRDWPERWRAFSKLRAGLLGTLQIADGRATGEYRSKPGPFRSTASWCF